MTTRSALVAVVDSHEGPWQRSRGNENGIVIRGMEKGGTIILDAFNGHGTKLPSRYIYSENGRFTFPPATSRWRASKIAGVQPQETFVQVVLK